MTYLVSLGVAVFLYGCWRVRKFRGEFFLNKHERVAYRSYQKLRKEIVANNSIMHAQDLSTNIATWYSFNLNNQQIDKDVLHTWLDDLNRCQADRKYIIRSAMRMVKVDFN